MAEAQDIKEAAWNKVRPTLNSPGRLGRAIIEGIPLNQHNTGLHETLK